jgi:predicted  nucleic acid-binding Zn-ribbon protein
MKQTDFIRAGIVLFALIIILAWVTVYNVDKINERVGALQGENTILKQNNQALKASIQTMQDSIAKYNTQISVLQLSDSRLQTESDRIKKSIKIIQNQYEKASTRANNFNADSMRRYFSNLQ